MQAALWKLGAAGVEEQDPPELATPPRQPWDRGPSPPPTVRAHLRAWFEVPDDALPASLVSDLAALAGRLAWEVAPVPDTDWAALGQDQFPRLALTDRLTVAAPWNAEPGDLIIDPGMGFGTGHHPTTAALLRMLERFLTSPGTTVVDVGCGSGILALAAARLGARASGIDVDADAVENARHNARLGDLDVAFSTTRVDRVPGPVDGVLANLHAELLVPMAPQLLRLAGRFLLLAGILDDKEESVRAAFDPTLVLVERFHEPPWVALAYERRR